MLFPVPEFWDGEAGEVLSLFSSFPESVAKSYGEERGAYFDRFAGTEHRGSDDFCGDFFAQYVLRQGVSSFQFDIGVVGGAQ